MTEEVARLEGQIKALIERLNQVRKDMPINGSSAIVYLP